MPKKYYIPIQLPPEQPDRCELCPLIGKIPTEERQKGVRQGYCCLGIFGPDGHPVLKSKGIKSSAAAWKAMGRKLHRPCDHLWPVWMTLPRRRFGISTDAYLTRRRPYEMERERKQLPKFNFRRT